ncbi:TPA: radical SAM protein [Candidatus Woesearchaeota archaeon]|nr:radical SAM protein [Candidatus Woesearchaeota archaeon]HIH31246.1 radical SAM protein [Candidatus Woesearchaeota archaeon]HIH54870.1 radical SAM protein [Candidatus Woesearchaeota archaeon]HIJ01931.1 radical SAM protein [Candidatus Woesearchaeota archaeon]HIJ13539.1 radical SAM protein [Candidatus Woesearchaeota archaeon]
MIRPNSPINVQLELTDVCNHACVHCYNNWRSYYPELMKKPNSEDIKILFKIGQRVIDADVFHIVLSGGEPLIIEKDDLENIISMYRINGLTVGVNSNITLADYDHGKLFKDLGVSVLASVISYDEETFDLVTQRKGSYKRFLEGAKNLVNNGIYLSSNMVVDKFRVNDVYDTGKFVANLGFKGFNATRISPSNSGMIKDYSGLLLDNQDMKKMLDQLIAVKKDFGLNIGSLNALPYCCVPNPEDYKEIFSRSCVAGLTTLGISSKGDVRACQHFDKSYGNILEEPLTSIWERMPVWKTEYSQVCNGCVYTGKCAGGCRENALQTSGIITGEDNLKIGGYGIITKRWDSKIDSIDEIVMSKGLKIRDEEFGAILYRSAAKYTFIDTFAKFIIKSLFTRSIIRKQDILEIGKDIPYVNKSYIDRLFTGLVNNGLASKSVTNTELSRMPKYCTNINEILYRFPIEQNLMEGENGTRTRENSWKL